MHVAATTVHLRPCNFNRHSEMCFFV
jgi:hypothetical protein